jgi:hypothetical protein
MMNTIAPFWDGNETWLVVTGAGLFAASNERNLFAIEIPKLGSFIASGNWTAREIGLETFPPEDRPPVVIPFFAFRIMVGMGLIMLAVSWFGNFLRWRGRLETTHWFLWGTFLAFPTGFIAVLSAGDGLGFTGRPVAQQLEDVVRAERIDHGVDENVGGEREQHVAGRKRRCDRVLGAQQAVHDPRLTPDLGGEPAASSGIASSTSLAGCCVFQRASMAANFAG